MRKAIMNLMKTTPELTALVPAEAWFWRSSVPDTPKDRWAVLSGSGTQRRGPGSRSMTLSVWVYDQRGSYAMINNALDAVEAIMKEVLQYEFGGERVAEARWLARSADLYDDLWRANTIYTDFELVGGAAVIP